MGNKILTEIRKNGLYIDDDVYEYGIFILIHYSLYIVFSIFIGFALKCEKEMIVFLISFYNLRKYVGGFHFDNSKVCTFFTVFIASVVSLLASKINIEPFFYMMIVFVTEIVIFKYGCVESKNKKLFENEKIIYTNKSEKTVAIYAIIGIISKTYDINFISNVLGFMLIFTIANLVFAKYVNCLSEMR